MTLSPKHLMDSVKQVFSKMKNTKESIWMKLKRWPLNQIV